MRYVFIFLALLISPAIATAQSDQCAALLREALEETNRNCEGMASDTVCYGAGNVQVSRSDGSSTSADFAHPSDTIGLSQIGQITTSTGVALIRLPLADTDDHQDGNIVLVMTGSTVLEFNVDSTGGLPPMQLYGSEGDGSTCANAPTGLMVQTPHGVPVTLTINGAEVVLGSTVYFSINEQRSLAVTPVEGGARVTSNGRTRTVVAGFTSQIKLNPDTNEVDGEWSEPELFDENDAQQAEVFESLDPSYLNYEIDAPDSDYLDELEDLLSQDDYDYDDFLTDEGWYDDEGFDDEDFDEEFADEEHETDEEFDTDEAYDDSDDSDEDYDSEDLGDEEPGDEEFYDDETVDEEA